MPLGAPDLCYAGTPTPAVSSSRCQIPSPHPHLYLLHLHPALPLINSRGSFLTSIASVSVWLSLCSPQPTCHPFLSTPVHPLCCLTGTSSAWGLLGVHRKFSGHPPISIHPFSRHLCVFTSPSLHVRQTTAAAIACLPFWTAWLCFQFPQGRLQRR